MIQLGSCLCRVLACKACRVGHTFEIKLRSILFPKVCGDNIATYRCAVPRLDAEEKSYAAVLRSLHAAQCCIICIQTLTSDLHLPCPYILPGCHADHSALLQKQKAGKFVLPYKVGSPPAPTHVSIVRAAMETYVRVRSRRVALTLCLKGLLDQGEIPRVFVVVLPAVPWNHLRSRT